MQADLKSTLSSLDQKTAHFQNHSLSYEPFRENQNKISQVFGASLQRWNLEQILPGNISPLRVKEDFFNNQLLAFLQRRSSLQKKEDLIDFLCVKIFTFRMERIFLTLQDVNRCCSSFFSSHYSLTSLIKCYYGLYPVAVNLPHQVFIQIKFVT